MKKIIFLILTLANLLYAHNYNEVLLKAQASIFPKIVLLDKKLSNKLIDGKIVYTIVYDKNDYQTALDIRKFIDESYDGHFDEYEYKISLVEFSDLSNETQASAIYVLNTSMNMQKVAKIVKEKGVVAFSYDLENLKQVLLFSLLLEKSTVLYLNKENLDTQKVDFLDSLLQIVKFIDNDNG